MDLMQICRMIIIYYSSVHFDTSLIDLDLDSMSQECEKAKKLLRQSSHKVFDLFGIILRLCGVMNLMLIFSRPNNFNRENPANMIS